MLRCFSIQRPLLRLAFHKLIVEENADQGARLFGAGQWHKAGGFQFQRFIATQLGSGLNGFDRGHRCRVMFARGLHHHAFGGGETHGGFDWAKLQWLELWLTISAPIQFAVDRLLQHFQRGIDQFFRGNHCIYQANLQCVFGADVFTGGDDLQCAVVTQQAW
ncbi:hypothetical protein D3C80_1386490 [compost metagenome]